MIKIEDNSEDKNNENECPSLPPHGSPGEHHKYLNKERTSAQVWMEETGRGKLTPLQIDLWTSYCQLPVFIYPMS